MNFESPYWHITFVPHRTFNPLKDKIEILRKLEEVAEELEGDMAEKGWAGRTVTLKFKRSTYEGEDDRYFPMNYAIQHQICASMYSCQGDEPLGNEEG